MDTQSPSVKPDLNLSTSFSAPVSDLTPNPSEKRFLPLYLGALVLLSSFSGLLGYYFGIQSKLTDNSSANREAAVVSTSPTALTTTNRDLAPLPTNTLPEGWAYKLSESQPNANDCVKMALPPMVPPYVYELDENRVPSVTEDKGSGRFWYLRGGSYANLLSKVTPPDQIKQNMAVFAHETEASGYISQAVAVSCVPNSSSTSNTQLIRDLELALEKYNSSSGEQGMEAQEYVVKTISPTTRWGHDVLDYIVDEDGTETNYTMFATPEFIYEVKVFGASNDVFVQETAQEIFSNLSFD